MLHDIAFLFESVVGQKRCVWQVSMLRDASVLPCLKRGWNRLKGLCVLWGTPLPTARVRLIKACELLFTIIVNLCWKSAWPLMTKACNEQTISVVQVLFAVMECFYNRMGCAVYAVQN